MPTYAPSIVVGYSPPSKFVERQPSFDRERATDENKRSFGSSCFKTICLVILILMILAAIILLIAGAIFRPRLPEIQVSSLLVTNFNLINNSMSGNFEVTFNIKNPNSKMTLQYDKAAVELSYESDVLVNTILNSFSQERKGETLLKASMSAVDKHMEDKVLQDFKEERQNAGSIEFDVKLVVPMSFDARVYKTESKEVKVFCKDLVVLLSEDWPNGSLSDASPRTCRVSF